MNPQPSQQARTYLRTQVMTATPEQLQMMLFDGAVRFAEQAPRVALEKKDFETSFTMLSRAQKIVTELTTSLKHKVAPELCEKLTSLYNYVFRNLVNANTRHDVKSLDEAIKTLRYQRETWSLLLEELAKQKAAAAASAIDLPPPSRRMEAMISVRG